MANLHFTVQGKGGCGKTTSASFQAQYLYHLGRTPRCIDTDPVNASFHAYKALNVHPIQIMHDNQIDPRAWDALVEILANTKHDAIIDNGATSFISLLGYMMENALTDLLVNFGHSIFFHIPITGSEGLGHTLNGMTQIVDQFTGTKFVIWLNPFLGPIEKHGQTFEQFEEYASRKEKIESIIQIPNFPPATFGKDLNYLLSNNLTFEESLEMKERAVKGGEKGDTERYSVLGLNIAVLQRISIMKRQVFAVLETSGVFA